MWYYAYSSGIQIKFEKYDNLLMLDIICDFNVWMFFSPSKIVRLKVLHIYRHPLVITPYYIFHKILPFFTGGQDLTQR